MDQLPPTWWWGVLRSKRAGAGENKGSCRGRPQPLGIPPWSRLTGMIWIKLVPVARSHWDDHLQTEPGPQSYVPIVNQPCLLHVSCPWRPTQSHQSLGSSRPIHFAPDFAFLLHPNTCPCNFQPHVHFLIQCGFTNLAMVMVCSTYIYPLLITWADPCLTGRFWNNVNFWWPKMCPSWWRCFPHTSNS